jgi:hypothetical protein
MTSLPTLESFARPNVLYIGLQKTGSSFLRAYFTDHPELFWTRQAPQLQSVGLAPTYLNHVVGELREKYRGRLTDPCAAWIDMYESIGLGYRLEGEERWNDELMLRSDKPFPAGVLWDPPGFFAEIARMMPDLKIMLTIRAQPEWLYSNYHHFIQRIPPAHRAFENFLNTAEGKVCAATAHFDRLVEMLYAVFGKDRLHVLPLEELERQEESALIGLCRFLGCEYVPFVPKEVSFNRGLDHRAAEPGESIKIAELAGRESTFSRQSLLDRLRGKQAQDLSEIPTKATLRARHDAMLSGLYALGNRRLSALLGRDLAALGYPV